MTNQKEVKWKVYFMEFLDRKSGRLFYKIGITQHGDALDRFSVENDTRWSQFFISCKASFWVRGTDSEEVRARAEAYEKYLHSEYPKNIWLEQYLDDDLDPRNWNDLHGITEIVALHHGISEDDILFDSGVKISSYRGALALFRLMKGRAEYDIEAPKAKEYKRCWRGNALSFDEVKNADRG